MSSGITYSQDIQDKAQSLGITPQQYMQIAQGVPNSYTGMSGGQNYGANPGDQSGSTYQAVANYLKTSGAAGGAKTGSSQSNQPTQPTYSSVDQNPMYDLSRLGASALGEQEIVNAVPGPADKKSGIGTVNQPQISQNKVTAPQGPWDTTPGVLTKTASTPTAPQTTALTPTAQATGATAGGGASSPANAFGGAFTGGGGDFGTQVASNAIQNEIQRQLAQGNAYASTNPGVPAGWHPSSTGQPNQTVTPPTPNPVRTNLPPPAPVNTSNTPGQTAANTVGQLSSALSSAIGAAGAGGKAAPGSVGAYGAAGGGAASDWASRFGGGMDSTGLSHIQKMQMLNQVSPAMNAGADAAKSWAQNAGNAFHPVQSAIPGPEDFMNRGNTVALQAPRVV